MSRPLQAHINLSALKHNLDATRQLVSGSQVIAVIKANGYGHGLLRVARALGNADGFAVLTVGEAIALREAGFKQQILLLEGFFSADELLSIAEYRLTPVIHGQVQMDILLHANLPAKVDVFLKMNSGMNRLGFRPEAFLEALACLRVSRMVGKITLMTHFATADEDEGIAEQIGVFDSACGGLDFPRCLANSAAIMRYPEVHAECVRPGIMLYGSSPFHDKSAAELGLKPVMTLSSEVIAVQQLFAGERVGYGGKFVADREMRIGIVACGYADGYPRHAPTGTPILVNGRRTRTLGRVSMDMLYVDLTAFPDAHVGCKVVLWGEGLPVDEVAHAAGTISYELLCALAPRVQVIETE